MSVCAVPMTGAIPQIEVHNNNRYMIVMSLNKFIAVTRLDALRSSLLQDYQFAEYCTNNCNFGRYFRKQFWCILGGRIVRMLMHELLARVACSVLLPTKIF